MNEQFTKFETHNKQIKESIAYYLEMVFKNSSDEFLNKQVLDRFLWTATEIDDSHTFAKYLGLPYWSKNAVRLYQNQNTGRGIKNFKDLRHDHSVPKSIIRSSILELQVKSFANIFEILNNFAHAVVITKQEDKQLRDAGLNSKMTEEYFNTSDIVSRYSKADIEVLCVKGLNLREISL